MLAERRRKTRYVLNPTKKPLWTTDSSGIKFGKELMEKMGWSEGKGLGANEQGIQEPLRVSSKNDTKGIGYKKNEENWIEYQDEFNVLLNQLAGNTDNNAQTKEADENKITSLEEKSKLSKARVHYQKFTRGKDLSKYSEEDLSCILGIGKIKKMKSETTMEKETSFENNLYETSFGVTTINSGSIKDYFKKKWTANNLNSENSKTQQFLSAEELIGENSASLEEKSTNGEKESRNEFLHVANKDEEIENKEIKKHKKRKKSDLEEEIPRKKEKNTCEIDLEIQKDNENPFEIENSPENISGESKKKKKKKRECEQLIEDTFKYQSEESNGEKINSKKEKKKSEGKPRNRNEEEANGNVMEEELQNETLKEDLKKARKKEKRREKSLKTDFDSKEEIGESAATEKLKNIEDAPGKKSSRKKKQKLDAEFLDRDNLKGEWEHQESQLEGEIEEELVKKRKKNKRKEMKNADENAVEFKIEVNIGVEKKPKKKKRSKESNEEQINEDLEGELENKVVEKKSVKKKEKRLEESEKEEEGLINKKFFVEEVAAAALGEKQKQKNKVHAETESRPEETRKKSGKKKKDNTLESQEITPKGKKDKTKSGPQLDSSGVATGTENEMDNKEKENENGKADFSSKTREAMIRSLAHVNKPFLGGFKNCTTAKVMDLICGAEIEKFKGANLGSIAGYGYKKKIENNVER